MRKRTFQDRKFGQGDSNSEAFRANWEQTFGTRTGPEPIDRPSLAGDITECGSTGSDEAEPKSEA